MGKEVKQGSLSTSLSVVGQLAAVQQADLTFERLSGTTKLLTLQVQADQGLPASNVDPERMAQVLGNLLSLFALVMAGR